MTGQELFLDVDGRRIAGLRWGNPDGPKALALHGWLDNAASFAALAPLLPELDFVAVDLPGHGRSEHRRGMPYNHFVDWVPIAVGIADALDWDRPTLVGHSMGAGISALTAGAFPKRFGGLVLFEGVGPFTEPDDEAPDRVEHTVRLLRERGESRPRVYATREDAARRLRDANATLSQRAVELLIERGTVAVRGGWVFAHDLRLRDPSLVRLTEAQLLAFLRRISCPTLAIRASNGLDIPEEWIARRVAAIDDVQSLTVPGGHHVHLDDPSAVIEPVRRFLDLG